MHVKWMITAKEFSNLLIKFYIRGKKRNMLNMLIFKLITLRFILITVDLISFLLFLAFVVGINKKRNKFLRVLKAKVDSYW